MILANNERLFKDYFVRLTAADLIAIGTGGTRQIGSIPIGGGVTHVGAINSVDIVGSSTLVIDVGTTSADPDEFIDALDVDAMTVGLMTSNTGDLMVTSAATTTFVAGIKVAKLVSAVTPIYIKVTDAAVASITAGEIVIVISIIDPLGLNL